MAVTDTPHSRQTLVLGGGRGAVVLVNLSLQLLFVNLKLFSSKLYLKTWCWLPPLSQGAEGLALLVHLLGRELLAPGLTEPHSTNCSSPRCSWTR